MDTSSTGAKFSILLCILVGPTSTAGTKRTPEYSCTAVLVGVTRVHIIITRLIVLQCYHLVLTVLNLVLSFSFGPPY